MSDRLVYTRCYLGVTGTSDGYQTYRRTNPLEFITNKEITAFAKYLMPKPFSAVINVDLERLPKSYCFKHKNDTFFYSFTNYLGFDIVSNRPGNFITDILMINKNEHIPFMSLDLDKIYTTDNEINEDFHLRRRPEFFTNEDVDGLINQNNFQKNYDKLFIIKKNMTKAEFTNCLNLILFSIYSKNEIAIQLHKSEVLMYLYMFIISFFDDIKQASITTYAENQKEKFLISGFFDVTKATDVIEGLRYNQKENVLMLYEKVDKRLAFNLGLLYDYYLEDFNLYNKLIDRTKKDKTNLLDNSEIILNCLLEQDIEIKIDNLDDLILIIGELKTRNLSPKDKEQNFDKILIDEKLVLSIDFNKLMLNMLKDEFLSKDYIVNFYSRFLNLYNLFEETYKIDLVFNKKYSDVVFDILKDKNIFTNYDLCFKTIFNLIENRKKINLKFQYLTNYIVDSQLFIDLLKETQNQNFINDFKDIFTTEQKLLLCLKSNIDYKIISIENVKKLIQTLNKVIELKYDYNIITNIVFNYFEAQDVKKLMT